MSKQQPKFYVVWKGREPGVYDSWALCKNQIDGFSGAKYKAFPTREQAEQAFAADSSDFIGKGERPTKSAKPPLAVDIITESIAVDAACSGNPGELEYQGVETSTGERLFHKGPFPEGTVNIGEFLAIVHGLALLKQGGRACPVYSDSVTAIGWVRRKTANTKLPRNARTEELFRLVERAEKWLRENEYANPILKWQTDQWGEIPADFGRK